MEIRKAIVGVVVCGLLLGACSAGAPHRVESEEFDPTFGSKTFSSLLVVGVYQDQTFRVSGETTLAEELKQRGLSASPSYDLLPDTRASAAELESAITAGSFDGVLTIATLDPGYEYDAGDYFATRGMVSMLGGEPGAATDLGALIAWSGSGLYTLHVGLWDAETGKPVWQITTDSEDTGSASGDLRALADFIVVEMRKKGLVEQHHETLPASGDNRD